MLVPGCKPAKMWLWTRHGTRNPSNDPGDTEIEDMYKFLPPLRDQIIINHLNGQGTESLSSTCEKKNNEIRYPRKTTNSWSSRQKNPIKTTF